MCRTFAFLVWGTIWAAIPLSVWAQGRAQGRLAWESLRTEATIVDVRPGLLQVTAEDGTQWFITPPKNLENMVFRGTASTHFLQPRMAVRFHTTFRPSERPRKEYPALEPVSSLEIITLRPGSEPNVYPDEAGAERAKLFEGDDDEQPAKQPDPPPAASGLSCLVIGTLLEHKNDKIKVSAGPFIVSAELPEAATVTVDVRHFLWTRPGDKVELAARYLPALPGRAEGEQLTITAAQPLTGDDVAGKNRRRAGRERK